MVEDMVTNPDKVLIERGVAYVSCMPLKIPLYNMKVGDSFFLTNEHLLHIYGYVTKQTQHNVRNAIYYYSKKTNFVFVTRMFKTGIRVWRLDDNFRATDKRKKRWKNNRGKMRKE